MPITKIETGNSYQMPIIVAQAKHVPHTGGPLGQSFAAMLGSQLFSVVENMAAQGGGGEVIAATSLEIASASLESRELIPLGKIDRETPTISHLLTGNSAYQKESWNIIFAQINKNKQFANIQQGTSVYLNPTSKELVWGDDLSSRKSMSALGLTSLVGEEVQASSFGGEGAEIDPSITEKKSVDGPILLGTLDAANPTLSHLLKSSPKYRDNAWDIIFSTVNRNKPYTSVRPGSLVSINPNTLELSFDTPDDRLADMNGINAKSSKAVEALPVELIDSSSPQQFSEKLAESVKAYLGKPYREIDCYALVVKGLKDQGVQYGGSGGLRNRLERMATSHGLPRNAYQNGEGLIKVAGNKLYDESFVRIKDAEGQSSKVMEQLQPILQEGMLLSFSTPTRGHTGVVAKKDGLWTYVNSGVIDHQVNGGEISKRVGEEKLEEEIKNWFKLAKNKRTSLKVSAGLFDTQKLGANGRMLANNTADGYEMI